MHFTSSDPIPKSIPACYRPRIQFWDDERREGNSLIVTLHYGWSFLPDEHEGVRGFDTVTEAKLALQHSFRCHCAECQKHL